MLIGYVRSRNIVAQILFILLLHMRNLVDVGQDRPSSIIDFYLSSDISQTGQFTYMYKYLN